MTIIVSTEIPEAVSARLVSSISHVFRRALDGELGREGKKGATTDALRGVLQFSIQQPDTFIRSFVPLFPSVLKLLTGPNAVIKNAAVSRFIARLVYTTNGSQASALCGLAFANCNAQDAPREQFSAWTIKYLHAMLSKRKDKTKLPPPLASVTAIFDGVNNIVNSKEATDEKPATPQETQTQLHSQASASISLIASFIVLCGPSLFAEPTIQNMFTGLLDQAFNNKRPFMKHLGWLGWRCLTWTSFMAFEGNVQAEMDSRQRAASVELVLKRADRRVGVGMLCYFLQERDSKADRSQRVSIAISVLKTMVKRKQNLLDLWAAMKKLLSSHHVEKKKRMWHPNVMFAETLFDGTYVDADPRSYTASFRADFDDTGKWLAYIPVLTEAECLQHFGTFVDIWRQSLSLGGVDIKQHLEVRAPWYLNDI